MGSRGWVARSTRWEARSRGWETGSSRWEIGGRGWEMGRRGSYQLCSSRLAAPSASRTSSEGRTLSVKCCWSPSRRACGTTQPLSRSKRHPGSGASMSLASCSRAAREPPRAPCPLSDAWPAVSAPGAARYVGAISLAQAVAGWRGRRRRGSGRRGTCAARGRRRWSPGWPARTGASSSASRSPRSRGPSR